MLIPVITTGAVPTVITTGAVPTNTVVTADEGIVVETVENNEQSEDQMALNHLNAVCYLLSKHNVPSSMLYTPNLPVVVGDKTDGTKPSRVGSPRPVQQTDVIHRLEEKIKSLEESLFKKEDLIKIQRSRISQLEKNDYKQQVLEAEKQIEEEKIKTTYSQRNREYNA